MRADRPPETAPPRRGAARSAPGAGQRAPRAGGSIADALRLDWWRDLRWAVPLDPWDAASHLARAHTLAAARGPLPATVLGILSDDPLCGSLGNLYVALGAMAMAREASGAVGAAVRPLLCLLPAAGAGRRALYALGRDGEVRRISGGRDAVGAPPARAALGLLGAMEEVTGRRWYAARAALHAARTEAGSALTARWTHLLWEALLAPFGAAVLHLGADTPPAGLVAAARTLAAAPHSLAAEARAAAHRLEAAGLRVPVPPAAQLVEPLGPAPQRMPGGGRPVLGPGEEAAAGREPGPPAEAAAGRAAPLGRVVALLALHGWLRPLGVVAGDEEVATLVQYSGVVEHLGGGRPVLRPRPHWTLSTPAMSAFARAHRAPIDEGPGPLRAARDRDVAARSAAPGALAAAQTLRAALRDHLTRLGQEVGAGLPRAVPVVTERGNRLLRGAELLEAEVAARQRAADRAAARAWRYLEYALYPFGDHQDEWCAAYAWLAGDAAGLIGRLLQEPAGPGRRFLRWEGGRGGAPSRGGPPP